MSIASLCLPSISQALRADCLSMLVDGLSYLGNLAAECHTDKGSKKVTPAPDAVTLISCPLLLLP